MNNEVLQFWNNAQLIYDSLINKSASAVLTENEAMAMAELGHMLEQYYRLQKLIIMKDIKKWEPKDDDSDADGFADIGT